MFPPLSYRKELCVTTSVSAWLQLEGCLLNVLRGQIAVRDMAHGHGHEHGHNKLELPDYRQWKIEGTPLENVQKKLAEKGLRDPWGRNEAWRYMGGFANNASFLGVILKGFKWGFAAFVVAAGAEYYLKSQNKDERHH